MLHSNRMQSDGFRLTPPDGSSPVLVAPDHSWPAALLFETPDQIFQRVYGMLRPRSLPPAVEIRFEPFANADSFIQFQNGRLLVRVTDLLRDAPALALESLAFILICKLFRKQIPAVYAHRYRQFLNRKDIRKRALATRQERGRKLCLDPQGDTYDLIEVFEEVNRAYFHGLMVRPTLGWSLRRSRTRLGHFDPSYNTIVISRIFDQPETPRLALDYVMFHEALHLRFPVDHSGARRCVHTKEFKRAEKEFPRLAEAKQVLKLL